MHRARIAQNLSRQHAGRCPPRRDLSCLAGFSPNGESYRWNQSTRLAPLPTSSFPSLTIAFHPSSLLDLDASTTHKQQTRFRSHDRASSRPRPKTKKQRQTYNRRMKRINDLQARNGAPGSKAGPRREWVHARWQQLLNHGSSDESTALETTAPEEYTYQDAVLEELMGNTSHLTSQPTPEPVYLGHRHRQYYNTVADQMDVYRESIQTQMQTTDGKALLDPSAIAALLPSDKQIANVVRAYRDRNGTRRQPIGIVMALQHLLQDLGVPTGALGEYSYTSLLTCCRTPKEARRIFQLMRDNNHEVSSYSWSIMVDIYAKMGDFEGCENVMKEMATHGHAPTLAAYTSLLSACYKVCSDAGRIPHAVRAKAGKFGWEKWQEMRIIGIEPDVMAYGAILRLCAARGLPERAIGLLEDMERFEVKPTTLCYSSALRAVAKSHETAIRFENGDSKRNLRRESIAAHHGKMARQIVIMAETVEVDQDDGFVSALMLCSAAAGDSATAKAVFLASEIRRMDNLRRIGSANVFADSSSATRKELVEGSAHTANQESISPSFGSELTEQPKSRHAAEFGKSTPSGGIKRNENFGEREYGTDTRVVSALMHASAQAMGDNGIGTIWAGRDNAGYLCENSLRLITTRWEPKYRKAGNPGVSSTKVGLGALKYVDERAREEEPMVGKRKKFRGLYVDEEALNFGDVTEEGTFSTSATERVSSPEAGDLFSDDDSNFDMDMQQLSMGGDNPIHIDNKLLNTSDFNQNDDLNAMDESDVFDLFLQELKEEAAKNGETFDLNEDEARELFDLMQEEFLSELEGEEGFVDPEKTMNADQDSEESHLSLHHISEDGDNNKEHSLEDLLDSGGASVDPTLAPIKYTQTALSGLQQDPDRLAKIQALQVVLPGLPMSRINKVINAFEKTLGYPSMLTLVPILRETMPDYVPSRWLKQNNNANAEFALRKASEDNVVDSSMLNSMLQVKANYGFIQGALDFHANEYNKHGLSPSAYSDRIVLQMLVSNDRLSRALEFKQFVEAQGRQADLASYGSLVQYYSRHNQLGSALLMLKECIQTHGAPPSEFFLSDLRKLFKKQQVSHILRLEDMIGNDPIEWLKHGERYLKREKSKKGRRDVLYAQNRLLG